MHILYKHSLYDRSHSLYDQSHSYTINSTIPFISKDVLLIEYS